MTGLFEGFTQYAGFMKVISLIGYFLLYLLIAAIVTGLTLFIVVQMTKLRVIEINLVNRRIKYMTGRYKKNKAGIRMLYIAKLKKFIPKIQEKDIFTKNRNDIILLIKDNNGLHHTARVPTYKDIRKWYKVTHGIDDIKTNNTVYNKIKSVYLLPNPAENLDWLANQISEADTEYSQPWYKSPTVMVIGTAAICCFTVIITIVMTLKFR